MRIKLVVFLMLVQISFFTKAEAGDEEYHIKILEALKRMNIRLVRIETNKIASIKAVQESLLNQLMALRTSIEQIQATGELNKSEMLTSVGQVKTKILDVESHVKNEVMLALERQNQEDKKYRTQLSTLFSQLKDSLATDIDALSKTNQQQFKVFSEINNKQLQQVVNALAEQNKRLLQTQALFKTDLIPALDIQSKETRQALLRELSQNNAVQKNFLESNHKRTLASLVTIDEKNKALIEILKKSIMVDEATKNLTEAIQQNIGGTNQNVDQTKKMIAILQEVLVQRMKSMAKVETDLKINLDQGLSEIKNNQNMAKTQLETLVGLSNQLKQQSVQMDKRIQLSETSASKQSAELEKGITSAKAQADLSSEKISRMIDILKSFAVEQDKIDQALKAFAADQGKVDQILQEQAFGQGKVDQILQGQAADQGKVDQILQGQKGLDATQKKITEALKDLRRKANVNISRSEDVLKKIKKTDDILKKMRKKK